ncbi:hypothetical protein PENSPDRAFT_650610 [Peniophora sp. CONT]|nr:hypothetical protein PENSPDRAFT_650610 [Peniophora sp. CONT]
MSLHPGGLAVVHAQGLIVPVDSVDPHQPFGSLHLSPLQFTHFPDSPILPTTDALLVYCRVALLRNML